MSDSCVRRLLDLIGHTYDAAQDEKLWPALAARMATAFDSNSGAVVVQGSPTGNPGILTFTENEVAARHRLSLNTVRTHLKSIFAKTGVKRQTELVTLVLCSVAVMNRDH